MKKILFMVVVGGLPDAVYSAQAAEERELSVGVDQRDEGYEDGKHRTESTLFHSEFHESIEKEGAVSDSSSAPVHRVQWHKVTYDDEPAGEINFEESPLSQKEKHAIIRQLEAQHKNVMLQQEKEDEEDERVPELSEIEAEYEALVGPASTRFLSIDPKNMSSSEIKTLSKTIAYLGIFKGLLAQLEQREGLDAQELEKVTAFKKRIIQERKDLLALQEKVGM